MLTESQIHDIHAGAYPPESYKHATILEYAKRFQTNVFIETGTYLGDTVEAVKNHFSQVYTIEIGPNLHRKACERFVHDPNVCVLYGSSDTNLKPLLRAVTGKLLFYLDSHFRYDGDSPEGPLNPTLGELDAIFSLRPDSIVLIDDARLFTGKPEQPNCSPEISVLEKFVMARMPDWVFEVENDIMRLHTRPA